MRYFGTILFACLFLRGVAADTLSLDLGAALNDYPQTENGYWEDTYVGNDPVEQGVFRFSHTGSADGGGGMAYWSGFTLCTSGDTCNYGAEGSSDGWITRQWGCMAGGGKNQLGLTEKGYPYLVAYWGFFEEGLNPGYHSLKVDFTDQQSYRPLGAWICNHPWPYYGNINGDGFADGFSTEGDYFALIAHGLNAQGEPTGATARLELAAYRNGHLQQSREWQYMDLTSLGTASGIYFTMETSDMDELYGANTAVYFCLGGLNVVSAEEDTTLTRPMGLQVIHASEDSLTLTWQRSTNASSYALWLDSVAVGATMDTVFTFTGLTAYTEYGLGVMAVAGKDSSELASITVRTPDMTPPTKPANLMASATEYSITLSWSPSIDNVGVARYTIYLDAEAYRRTTATSHTLMGLEPATEYKVEVEAMDEAGNRSERATIQVMTLETALPTIDRDDTSFTVYTLDGQVLGHQWPHLPGVYLIRTESTTYKITIIY